MKLRNGFYCLTWLEGLAVGHQRKPPPWWVVKFAPLQHWFLTTFCGHKTVMDVGTRFVSPPIPRTGPPPHPKARMPDFMFEHPTDEEVLLARSTRCQSST